MRILLDYRPALRQRSGVGEYVHGLARALLHEPDPSQSLVIFTSSWKDRLDAGTRNALAGAQFVDRRLPVRALTWVWHHAGWPPVECLAGPVDVVHASGPLLIPARRAAQIVTIHDLDFLRHPERTRAEMRRDYPALVRDHAARAHHVIVSSACAAEEVRRELGLPDTRITVCAPGRPAWADAVADRRQGQPTGAFVLFLGTVEPRKNIGGLLAAHACARERDGRVPPLVIAGHVTSEGQPALDAARASGDRRHVRVRGYVSDRERQALLEGARMLVLPSFDEGFGLPVLEAMACGVPVVISNRGALPEVAGSAAVPVAPDDHDALAQRMMDLMDDETARRAIAAGLSRAAQYTWASCAARARMAYRTAAAYAHRG